MVEMYRALILKCGECFRNRVYENDQCEICMSALLQFIIFFPAYTINKFVQFIFSCVYLKIMTKLKHQGSVKEFFAKVRKDPKNYLQTGVSHRVIHSDEHYSSNDSFIS